MQPKFVYMLIYFLLFCLIFRSIIPELYRTAAERLRRDLEVVEHIGLTTDEWTSRSTRQYMAVTVHYFKEFVDKRGLHIDLKSTVVSVERVRSATTAVNLSESLVRVMTEWDVLQKVHQITTDNANNIVKAVEHSGKAHVPCFAHCLNLVVKHTLEHFDGEDGKPPLKQAREAVRML